MTENEIEAPTPPQTEVDGLYEALERLSWFLSETSEYIRHELQQAAKYWVNPPTYQVTEGDTFADSGGVNLENFSDETPAPWRSNMSANVWKSLEQVPVGVVVRDKDGDCWKVTACGRLKLRFKTDKKWEKANKARYRLSAWDHFGPFTKVDK